MQINIKQAESCVEHVMKAGLVSYLKSSPGIGKSDLIKSIANKYNLKLIDLRLSQMEPTELNGYPTIKDGVASYVPMDIFPLESAAVPKGYSGWLLFFDEISSCVRATQAAAYRVILDREVGNHKLHKNVAIACAGNLETDNAIVEEMSTALQSRMIHFNIAIDKDSWIKWAYENGVDSMITSFIEFKPSSLYTFNPESSDSTYACPRTWAFLSKIMGVGKPDLAITAGTVGEGVAREFHAFMGIYQDLPTIDSILADPEGVRVRTDPSVLYALTGAIAQNASEKNIKPLMQYVERLPLEFQIITLREIKYRDKDKKLLPHITSWIVKFKDELL